MLVQYVQMIWTVSGEYGFVQDLDVRGTSSNNVFAVVLRIGAVLSVNPLYGRVIVGTLRPRGAARQFTAARAPDFPISRHLLVLLQSAKRGDRG